MKAASEAHPLLWRSSTMLDQDTDSAPTANPSAVAATALIELANSQLGSKDDSSLQQWELDLRAADIMQPKATKREILTATRDDWDYPRLSSKTYVSMNRITPYTRYIRRQMDSQSNIAEPEGQASSLTPTERQNSITAFDVGRNTTSDYLYQYFHYTLCQREMAVNPGLHHFVHRRDAWTAAATRPCPCSKYPGGIPCWLDTTTDPTFPYFVPLKSDYPSVGHPLHKYYESKSSYFCATSDIPPLVPIAPPIISSDHPVRALIKPENYEAVYRDFVAEGKNPKVPINLADLTKAIVVGLRASGKWPPKEGGIAAGDKIVGRPGTWRSKYQKVGRNDAYGS